MSFPYKPRHLTCSICSQLRDHESATEYVQQPESNTGFPLAVSKLKVAKEIDSRLQLMQCPECGTYYLMRHIYEFLIGYGGSYDESILWRITDEMGKDYAERRLSKPPAGMM